MTRLVARRDGAPLCRVADCSPMPRRRSGAFRSRPRAGRYCTLNTPDSAKKFGAPSHRIRSCASTAAGPAGTKQSPLFSRPGANATNGRLFLDISIETVATGGFITNLFAHWTNWFVPAFQTWPAAGAMIASGPTTARSRFNRPSETHRSHGPGKSGPGSTDATDDCGSESESTQDLSS